MTGANEETSTLRYEADQAPPKLLAAGLGAQLAVLTIGGVVLTPMIVVQAGGGSESFLNWAVFAAVIISGATTCIQAIRVGRFGAGYVLAMGTSGAFIAICATALAEGGPGLLATLVLVSSIFQFALARKLDWFRNIFTPVVAGTVIMLIPVTVMPILFDMLSDVPDGAPAAAAPVSAALAFAVILALAIKSNGLMRLWALVVGVFAGSLAGLYYGIYDTALVGSARWFGLPDGGWGGFDFEFGVVFWSLLPGFIFVTLIGAVETIGDSVAIQRVSWRKKRAVDFRAVQGAVTADGLGNFLSGLAGTVPNTTYSSSISVTELTGVASRTIGAISGFIFILFAFSPKLIALILAIPAPVVAAYAAVALAMLFIVGMKVLFQDGINYRKGIIAGTAFWAGAGFQNNLIFPEYLTDFAGGLLQNGMTTGGLVAIILTLFLESFKTRPRHFDVELKVENLAKIREFFKGNAKRFGWGEATLDRLDLICEEVLLLLLEEKRDAAGSDLHRQSSISAKNEGKEAVLEFVSAAGDENFQDQLALIGEQMTEASIEKEFSLRILKRYASSVRHQQYFDAEIISVRVGHS